MSKKEKVYPTYIINTKDWVTASNYARERGVTRQTVNYWINEGKVESESYEELGITMIRRGTEKGVAANGLVRLPVKLPPRSNAGRKSKMSAGLQVNL